ncbi:MAG TPA: FAD-binding protein [Gemmatimonadaceae bacterium]|nr:FAD-binding protein [Gemmatimonadaceae bacterium]
MSTERVAARIRGAVAARTPLRISGASTWLDAGRPVSAKETLSLRGDSGVVSYVPGDLTLTVRAGTSLAEIERVTAEHDQWLPLDPYGSAEGTIGATISTASAGPLATGFGLPRDLVLGMEFVSGRGEVITCGGKVVKNVAGFDLTRLLTGSWGSLGVITEVTLRLYARPKVDRTFVVRLSGNGSDAAFLEGFLAARLSPFAFEILSASAVKALDLGNRAICLIRFGGNAAGVDGQLAALAQLGRSEEIDAKLWSRLRNLENGADCVIRVSGPPANFRDASPAILSDDLPEVLTWISPARGLLRLVTREPSDGIASDDPVPEIDPRARPDEHTVFEKLPTAGWRDIPSAVSDRLSQRIKRVFDGDNLLNPGILGS